MDLATTLMKLATQNHKLEVMYLGHKGWTNVPDGAIGSGTWTRQVHGTELVLGQGLAMIVQRWLDSLD